MSFNISEYLSEVLETHRMKHIEGLTNKYKSKRDEIKEALEEKYKSKIYTPFNSGSFAKHTAINIKFDLDIVVPFKKATFDTIEAMYNEVYSFLYEKYHKTGKAIVRKQKVSIGILFKEDKDGDEINIDVVPGREVSKDCYLEDRDLNIYLNDDDLANSKAASYTKTNIEAQIQHIKSKDSERQVIRLLKIWKNTNGESYKSFLLELITIKAFEKENIKGSLWEKLKAVMTYIKENITKDSFSLIDPGNSNNDLIDFLDNSTKKALSNKMKIMLDRIESKSENIKSYFPINEAFQISEVAEKSSNSYGFKTSIAKPSIPSNVQRFG